MYQHSGAPGIGSWPDPFFQWAVWEQDYPSPTLIPRPSPALCTVHLLTHIFPILGYYPATSQVGQPLPGQPMVHGVFDQGARFDPNKQVTVPVSI